MPESSALIKSILEFCYSGDYLDNSAESSGGKALLNAKLYVAVDKYDIRGMKHTVNSQMSWQIHACERELQVHSRIVRHAAAPGDSDRKRVANDALDAAAIVRQELNWGDLLTTVGFLLEYCHQDDGIRNFLAVLDWSSIVIDEYQADWIVFLASHPNFAAEVISIQGSEEWRLNHIMDNAKDEVVYYADNFGDPEEFGRE